MERSYVDVIHRWGAQVDANTPATYFCIGYAHDAPPDDSRCIELDGMTGDPSSAALHMDGDSVGVWLGCADFVHFLRYPEHYSFSSDLFSQIESAHVFLDHLNVRRKQAVFDSLVSGPENDLRADDPRADSEYGLAWVLSVCTVLFRVNCAEHDLGSNYRTKCMAFMEDRVPWASMTREIFQAGAECVHTLGSHNAVADHQAWRLLLRLSQHGERFVEDEFVNRSPIHPTFSDYIRGMQLVGDGCRDPIDFNRFAHARNWMAYALAGQVDPTAADATICALVTKWTPPHPPKGFAFDEGWFGKREHIETEPVNTSASEHLQYRLQGYHKQGQFLNWMFAGTPHAQVVDNPLAALLRHNRLARSVRHGGPAPEGHTHGKQDRVKYRYHDAHSIPRNHASGIPARYWIIDVLAPIFRRSVGVCFARLHLTQVLLGIRAPSIPLDVIDLTCGFMTHIQPHERWEHDFRNMFYNLQNFRSTHDGYHRGFTRRLAGAAADSSDLLVAQACYTLGIGLPRLLQEAKVRESDTKKRRGDGETGR
jgi:hypothetical protein